jgi:hypothetical protein
MEAFGLNFALGREVSILQVQNAEFSEKARILYQSLCSFEKSEKNNKKGSALSAF